MKKIIALVAFACALGAFASLPHADETRQAAAEPAVMLAMLPVPQSLKVEAYDAI
ncbi:MAG: hypothetical protein Q7T45_00365 [Bradyrhizobium sp.]|uniref:hypothetical protein n=1 Tax=Bradyrhizobium sp. TaxID=376 RepID=UPI00271AD460|nr:hypothetical protein [Bradyrhizobium sp.]MDO8396252.1 hypothetical protein [Bradyrhizobium sp.]